MHSSLCCVPSTCVCVCVCVIWGQLDMQLNPRKLHRCRPVRDSRLVAAAWVCLCVYVGMSFLAILYMHGMCVRMSKCVCVETAGCVCRTVDAER